MKKIILAGILCVLPMSAYAADMTGIGAQNCSVFNNMNPSEQNQVFSWVQGAFSALNASRAVEYHTYVELNDENFNWQGQLGMLKSLCQNNPDDAILNESIIIYFNMMKMGLKRTVKP